MPLPVLDRRSRPRHARARDRAGVAFALAVAVLVVAGALPVVAADPAPTPTPDPTITFYGRGYGHGVGMSQYGARGRALAGQDAPTILVHYYPETTLGTTDPLRPVRVLVLHAFKPTAAVPLRLYGRGGTWTIDGVAGTWPANAMLLVTRTATGYRIVVRSTTGATLLSRNTAADLRVRPTNPVGGRIQVWSKPGSYDTYRGTIRLRAGSAGIDAVDEVSLDAYLLGVVPAEMPSSWPTEALKAQAIASRSYAARRLHPTTGTWDLYDDTRTQVYRGSLGEKATTTAAVTATAGQVVKSGSSIANTLYHSTGGGATENNENVFVSSTGAIVAGPVSYLRGSPDRAPDGTAYDAAAPRATWQTAAYTMAQLSAIFGADPRTNAGALTKLDLSQVGVSGRLIRVTLIGSLGSKTVSGEVFRSVFNTRSPAADPYMWSTLVAIAPIP